LLLIYSGPRINFQVTNMQQPGNVFKIFALSLTLILLPIGSAMAGLSISISNGGHPQRSWYRSNHYGPAPPYYYNRYGQRFLRNPSVYFDRYGRRYFHQKRHSRRIRNCDVIIVRPRYGQPYRVMRNCIGRPFAAPRLAR